MRRATSIVLLVAAAVVVVRVLTWRPFEVAEGPSSDRRTRVAGVVHVHTTRSDGRGTPEQVIAAARAAGLDFIVITDHGGLDAKRYEGYSGGLLVLVGTEISTQQGHVLGFGFPEPAFRFPDEASEVIEDLQALGGAAVIAHPDSPRQDFRWTRWDLPGPWGIELLNGDTQWRSAGWMATAWMAAAYPLNSTYALLGLVARPGQTLDRWDRLLGERDVPMIAGADAHGFPSYEPQFSVTRNHLVLDRPLSGDAKTDIAAVVAALARGRGYVAVDGLAPASGFSFIASQGDRLWTMGETVAADPPPRLRAGGTLPEGATVHLFHDGRPIKDGAGELEWPEATAGVYRVEVRLPGWDVPWVLSNPIYVFDPAAQRAREERARVPQPAVPDAAQVLEAFDDAGGFEPASDESTRIDRPIMVPGSGADSSSAARLRFTLGSPTEANPSPFAALASLRSRDLSGRRGLVFSIRGDAVRRVWVQVRDANPQSEHGTEWWYASVRTTTDWRRVSVPFDRLRTRDSRSDGRLDLRATRGIVFIVDLGVARPGTAGEIWLEDIGVY
jgi:hypothetical protein